MATKYMSRTIGLLNITLYKKKSTNKSPTYSPRSPGSNSYSPRARSREEQLKDVFKHFDINQDGKITAAELRIYFATTGETVSQEEAQEVIDELDSDKDGMLEFEDFVRLMDTKNEGGGGGGGDEEDLRKVFEMFEHVKGSGRITPRGLQRAFNRLGDSKSYNECVTMIQVFDMDGDGVLDFNEFHHMMVS
ncbi:hypothetical protein vseg_015835 [Gypsophila vaccaria]